MKKLFKILAAMCCACVLFACSSESDELKGMSKQEKILVSGWWNELSEREELETFFFYPDGTYCIESGYHVNEGEGTWELKNDQLFLRTHDSYAEYTVNGITSKGMELWHQGKIYQFGRNDYGQMDKIPGTCWENISSDGVHYIEFGKDGELYEYVDRESVTSPTGRDTWYIEGNYYIERDKCNVSFSAYRYKVEEYGLGWYLMYGYIDEEDFFSTKPTYKPSKVKASSFRSQFKK